MAKKPSFRNIQNIEFEFYPIPPTPGLRIVTRILKLAGEPIGLVIDAALKGGKGNIVQKLMDGNISGEAVASAMRSLTDRLDEDEVINTITMLVGDHVHGKFPGDQGTRRLNIETDFAGELGLLIEVFVAAVEINFASFLQGKLGKAISS